MQRFPRRHRLPSGQLKRALFQCAIEHLAGRGDGEDADRPRNEVIKKPKTLPSVRTVKEHGAEPGEYAVYETIIRTSQTLSISFTRNEDDTGWAGLQDVSDVTISRVDSPKNPQYAHVATLGARQVEARFNEAYAAAKARGQILKPGTGFWLPLSELVGQNIQGRRSKYSLRPYLLLPDRAVTALPHAVGPGPLLIPEARRLLALTYGVPEKSIRIKIEI